MKLEQARAELPQGLRDSFRLLEHHHVPGTFDDL
jgi:hypothetical protein